MKLLNLKPTPATLEESFSVKGNLTGRYLVIVEDGNVTGVLDAAGDSLVDSKACRIVQGNMSKLQRQLSYLNGEQGDNVLFREFEDL